MATRSPLNRRYFSGLNQCLRAAFRVASVYKRTPIYFLF